MKNSTFKKLQDQQLLFLNKHSTDLIGDDCVIWPKGMSVVLYDVDTKNKTIRCFSRERKSTLMRFNMSDLDVYSNEINSESIYITTSIVFLSFLLILICIDIYTFINYDFNSVPVWVICVFMFLSFNSIWLYKKSLKQKFKKVSIFEDIKNVKPMSKHLKLFRKIKPFIVGWSIVAFKRVIDVSILLILLKIINLF